MSYERAAAVVCDDECGRRVYGSDLHNARMKARAEGWWNMYNNDLCPEHLKEVAGVDGEDT